MKKIFAGVLFLVMTMLTSSAWAETVYSENFSTNRGYPSGGEPIFSEDFSDDLDGWTLFGSPQSRVLDAHGYNDVFDNNGDGWCGSGAMSDATVDIAPGTVVQAEFYLQVDNYEGCWVSGSIGLTNMEANESGSCAGENYYSAGLTGIQAKGEACWAAPDEQIGHSFVWGYGGLERLSENNYINGKYIADDYVNAWHTLKVEVLADYYVKVFIDGTSIGTSKTPIPTDYRTDQHIILGSRSSDYGGKVYIDNVSVVAGGPGRFARTTTKAPYKSEYNQYCVDEYGSNWGQADWSDIQDYYNNGGSLEAIASELDLSSWVKRNGATSYSSSRDYFIAYHNHNKPSNFLAHDNLDNYYISLGSWYGERPVFCVRKGDGGDCTETDTGALDVAASCGSPGSTVSIPVRIQSAPNAVSALGFEVVFPASLLTYTGYTKGTLVNDWTFFEATNPDSGVVRVGGFTSGTAISSGQSGYVVYLKFTVSESCSGSSEITLQNLLDDLEGWSSSLGCMDCNCGATCDINGDGEITPQDALCAFEKYMGVCPTSCGDCASISCDVNQDGDCTPADALEIFKECMGIRPNACSQ